MYMSPRMCGVYVYVSQYMDDICWFDNIQRVDMYMPVHVCIHVYVSTWMVFVG